MSQFMLLLRNEIFDWKDYSEEEYQKILAEFNDWYHGLIEKGKFVGSGKLSEEEGITLRSKDGEAFTDGPYCESKESVAGIFIVKAENYKEAAKLGETCPMIRLGGSIEIRKLEIDMHTT